jgi:membrane fusion protein, copper/silver efflux system
MSVESPSKRVWIGAALGVLLLGGGGGFLLARYLAKDAPAPAPAETKAERKVLYWHDPMVPGAKFDKPGKSPYMDMQLVPVYADEAGGEAGGVRVPENVVQSLGIRIGKVERTTLQSSISVVGNIAFDDRLVEVLPARVEGYVTRLYVHSPLERVRRGQPLAEIQAPAWLEAQQEYLALLDSQSETGQALRKAARERLHVLGVPERTIRAIESQRRTQSATLIVSPIDGVVSELGVREGAAIAPGSPLFRINGLKTVWANARVPEAQVAMLPIGSAVNARASAWPGDTFSGRLIALLPQVELDTRTMTARVEIDNAAGKLAPGMFVNLDLAAPAGEPALVVPSEAVIATGQHTVVVTRNDDGSFGVATVTIGAEQNGKTVILSGLDEGQSIVLSGQFLIDSEASLKSTVTRLGATP